MRTRRWPWLVAAAALIAVAVFLMSREDPRAPAPAWQRVELPRQMDREDHARAKLRRTMPVPSPPVDPKAPPEPPRPRDPLLAALPSSFKKGVVVVEVNAIRHSPVGELLIDCLTSRDDGRGLQRMRDLTGVDPLEDLDRVALADDALLLSGHFEDAKWDAVFPSEQRVWGRDGTIYSGAQPDGGVTDGIGTWGGKMLILGQSDAEVEAVMDRLEGRGIQGPPVLDESQTYGDIYGVLTTDALAELLTEGQPGLAEKLKTMADRVELHVDAARDVGLVAKVTGPNGEDTRDLGKTMGAALALGRLKAQADGETELAELMELARVVPGSGDFRLELGLPLELLEKHLTQCVADNQARNVRRRDAGVP